LKQTTSPAIFSLLFISGLTYLQYLAASIAGLVKTWPVDCVRPMFFRDAIIVPESMFLGSGLLHKIK